MTQGMYTLPVGLVSVKEDLTVKKKSTLVSVVAACVILVVVAVVGIRSATGPGYFRATFEARNGETLDFYKDGTVELFGDSMLFEGTYERTEKNTYTIRINALIMQLRFTAVKDGNTLTVTDNADAEVVYVLKKT